MDYLQYFEILDKWYSFACGFKPYYKWITFNTLKEKNNTIKEMLEF